MATQPETLRIGVLHGPNLNLLGRREPEVYGRVTLVELNQALAALGESLGVTVTTYQANSEGELVDYVQRVGPEVAGFIVNAAAFTHTSIAIRDALLGVSRPFVEVHLSNVFGRESFRHHSYLSDCAIGMVVGFGPDSYLLGLRGLVGFLQKQDPSSTPATD